MARLAALDGVVAASEDEDPSCVTFVRPGNAMHASWDTTVVGTARIGTHTLEVESNSIRRADDLRRRVEAACGTLVSHRARARVDPSELTEHAPAALDPPPPEADAFLRAFKERHYADWVDQELPALGGRSPRAAVRSKGGRAQVEILLKDIEYREASLPAGQRFDFSPIRDQLGLSRR
jgi:hypothetical protein